MLTYDELKLKNTNEPLSFEKWNGLVDKLATTQLEIPDNENGEILNHITIGTKPNNGKELNYPWSYETIGVTKTNVNLRLQSPKGIYVHTGIGKNENENKSKIRLAITKEGRVGIGLADPKSQLHIFGDGFIRLQQKERPKEEWGELNVTKIGTLRLYQHDKKGFGGIDILANGNVGIGVDKDNGSFKDRLEILGETRSGLSISNRNTYKKGSNELRFFTARKDEKNLFGTSTKGKGNKGWMLQSINEDHTDAAAAGDLRVYYFNDNKWRKFMSFDNTSGDVVTERFKTNYLAPGFKSAGKYEFLRFGTPERYYAGFMWNEKEPSYGVGNNFSIFTYANRNINIKPHGTGFTFIQGNLTFKHRGSQRGNIIMLSAASNTNAKDLLKNLKPHQLIIGGANDKHVFFYWKDKQGRNRRAMLGGSYF